MNRCMKHPSRVREPVKDQEQEVRLESGNTKCGVQLEIDGSEVRAYADVLTRQHFGDALTTTIS